MRPVYDFVQKLRSTMCLDAKQMLRKGSKYYLLGRHIKTLVTRDFFYAGTYLGKIKGETFFPSFALLAMMAKQRANKTTINARSEWLFICGRDIFKQGIVEVTGPRRKGTYTLILNERRECLGFGKILRDPKDERSRPQPVIRNITDVGDFLRRERKPPRHQ